MLTSNKFSTSSLLPLQEDLTHALKECKKPWYRNLWRERSLLKLASAAKKFFLELEKEPVQFGKEKLLQRKRVFQACANQYKETVALLKKHGTKKTIDSAAELRRYYIGFQYRREKENGGWNQSGQDLENTSIYKKALNFKRHDDKRPEDLFREKTLTQNEIQKLQALMRYPKFVSYLQKHPSVLHAFFKWTFLFNMDVDLFLQFPNLANLLEKTFLAMRIGYFAKKIGQLICKDAEKKDVTLWFNTDQGAQRISLLDETKHITFATGKTHTLKEIFDNFSKRNERMGDFEMLHGVLHNWNSFESLRNVDLTKENWYEDIPVFDEITKEELMERHGLKDLEDGKWVHSLRATRRSADGSSLEGCHGYKAMAVPIGKGKYNFYPMGKLAQKYPIWLKELLRFLGGTGLAFICIYDESEFMAGRQKGAIPSVLTEDLGKVNMRRTAEDIQKGLDGKLFFQFAAKNCLEWAISSFKESMEGREDAKEHFKRACDILKKVKRHFLTLHPGALNPIFVFIRKLPGPIKRLFIWLLCWCLGTHRTLEIDGKAYSVAMSSFVEDHEVVYPPAILELIDKKEEMGAIMVGMDRAIQALEAEL